MQICSVARRLREVVQPAATRTEVRPANSVTAAVDSVTIAAPKSRAQIQAAYRARNKEAVKAADRARKKPKPT